MASTMNKWHINKNNEVKRCLASKRACRYQQHYDTEDAALKAAEALIENDTEDNGTKLQKPSPSEKTEPTEKTEVLYEDYSERITTLLTAKVPMQDERKGKVPSLEPTDTPADAVNKLGRYIEKNFNGDFPETSQKTMEKLFDKTLRPFNPDDAANAGNSDAESIKRLIEKFKNDGIESACYVDDNNDYYISTRGKITGQTTKTYAYFRRTGTNVHTVNFGRIMAADAIIGDSDMTIHAFDGYANSSKIHDATLTRMLEKKPFYYYGTESEDDFVARRLRNNKLLNAQLEKAGISKIPDNAGYTEFENGAKKLMKAKNGKIDRYLEDAIVTEQMKRNDYYGKFMDNAGNILNDERNGELNRNYAVTSNRAHSATVYQDKKNQDPEHIKAGNNSAFKKDFDYIEIDDSVDLSKFNKIQDEYASFRKNLPATPPAQFRFRKTGRHHALGVYTPAVRNIAVDPRSPSAFTHEYMHHFDFTGGKDHAQLSMSSDFRPIVQDYQDKLDKSQIQGDATRYTAPTEVFARAGELWMHWSHEGMNSSFLDTDKAYASDFDYAPLLKHKKEIMSFFDNLTKRKN